MEPQNQRESLQKQPADITPTQPGPFECTVQNVTAKFFLNRPEEDLIPARYLKMARQTPTAQRKPWIFRGGVEDAHEMDIGDWSKVDIRYRGVFRTLPKCPRFKKGLWEAGCESCEDELESGRPRAQAQVVYALLCEIGEMLDLRRETCDGENIFYLTPRLLSCQLEYWTGYREKHKDAPDTAGFLSLEIGGPDAGTRTILPVSTTMKEESLVSALADKFKLILGQLLLHVRPLPLPGDKLPDQEIFLTGLHGSKLHLMHAFFPGQKLSSLWCRREVPGPAPMLPATAVQSSLPSSPDTLHSTHVEYCGSGNGRDDAQDEHSTSGPSSRARSDSNRFYAPDNMERLRQHLETTRLISLDHEPNLRTFRVLGTREYDLWKRKDFADAVHVLIALHLYLLSGKARCGALQELFERHPYVGDDADSDEGLEPEEDCGARLRDDVHKEELELEEKEEELRREELIKGLEDAEAVRVREAMRHVEGDRISSLRDARQHWWDFVWQDEEESMLPKDEDGEGDEHEEMEMIIGNVDL